MPQGDPLGDRMKAYEESFTPKLPKRLPVIVRVDGKAFHTLTRGCEKPFDREIARRMDGVAVALCEELQGAVLAYVQSDEVSVWLHNYKRLETQAAFDNGVQKIASVSASVATRAFGEFALFDARCFVLPEAEVANYFVWRQKDCIRNAITGAAFVELGHKACQGISSPGLLQFMPKFADHPSGFRHGRIVDKGPRVAEVSFPPCPERYVFRARPAPLFTENRDVIEQHLTTTEPTCPSPTS